MTELGQRADGTWDVITEKGNVHAEHVVNCGGLWAREVGRMVGLELPVLAMEHMYLVTEDMPETQVGAARRLLHVIDFEGEIYMRQERGGMLLGTYEQACEPWSPKETPWDFGHELLQPDLDRIAPSLEVGFKHFPALEQGRHQARSSTGPSPSRRTAIRWSGRSRACAISGSPAASWRASARAAASGLALSNWMVNGDPGFDVWAMDVARFGEWATLRLHQRQGARELFAALPHPLPQRGTAGRAAAAHDADLRPAAGARTP